MIENIGSTVLLPDLRITMNVKGQGVDTSVVRKWLMLICGLIVLMVMLGGITRLTQSGLSMTSWQFTGSLPPMNTHEWQTEFSRYKLSPEYRKINFEFSLSDFQSIYWWEYVHRMTGRLIGIVFLIPFIVLVITRKISRNHIAPLLGTLLLIVSQGLLGWLMVKSGLKDVPHVNHFLLAAHFSLAITTLVYTFQILLRLKPVKVHEKIPPMWLKTANFIFAIIFAQLILGALVAGLKGGLIFNTFPKMGEHWIAPEVFNGQGSFFQNAAGMQFLHRVLAFVILVLVIRQYRLSRRSSLPAEVKNACALLLVLVGVQITIGITCLLLQVPTAIGVTHQCTGIFLLLTAYFVSSRTRQYSDAGYRIKQQTQAHAPAANDHYQAGADLFQVKAHQSDKTSNE